LTLAAIVGLATGLGMSPLGPPYAVVLGVLAGLFELIPTFGPILSAVPAIIVALFLPFPTVIWVIVFFVAVQQLENNLLAPRLGGHAVGLHPLGAMFAPLAGFEPAPPPCWALPRWRACRHGCSRCLVPNGLAALDAVARAVDTLVAVHHDGTAPGSQPNEGCALPGAAYPGKVARR
jgi:hypothetical protein